MKDFCVDLQLAKELKENGFPQKCNFSWVMIGNALGGLVMGLKLTTYKPFHAETSAPISDEILKELPKKILTSPGESWFVIIKDNENNWQIYYEVACTKNLSFRIIDKKLSNCAGKAWLYLKKEGYIK